MRMMRLSAENDFSSFHVQETKPSQLSNAVQGLVATAGGVYLSLIMVVSFLKINLPQVIDIGIFAGFFGLARGSPTEISFDPLALVAISLAIIEPIAARIFNLSKKIKIIKGR